MLQRACIRAAQSSPLVMFISLIDIYLSQVILLKDIDR